MTALFDLHGKTAIITGASSGFGEQFARCLSGAGGIYWGGKSSW
jgi:NADP-dependent 3-hydroxy acid dehydrogenase YdfG